MAMLEQPLMVLYSNSSAILVSSFNRADVKPDQQNSQEYIVQIMSESEEGQLLTLEIKDEYDEQEAQSILKDIIKSISMNDKYLDIRRDSD